MSDTEASRTTAPQAFESEAIEDPREAALSAGAPALNAESEAQAATAETTPVAASPTAARLRAWAIRVPRSPRTVRLVAAAAIFAALLTVVPVLLNSGHHAANATELRPTATSLPPTPIPSPTSIAGYQPLVDSSDGFVIQHPLAWSCSPSHPGVDCIDSPDAQTYRLQVQLPGNWTAADVADASSGTAWVNYALSAFSDVPGRTFDRVPVTDAPDSIGGAKWDSGAAIIGIDQSNGPDGSGGSDASSPTPAPQVVRIRVQVYATVHDNTPYIIAVYAADDTFVTGSDEYFRPMLRSFAFLPTDTQH